MTNHTDTQGASTNVDAPSGAPPRHCAQHPTPDPTCAACAKFNDAFIEWARSEIAAARADEESGDDGPTGRRLRVTLGSDVRIERIRWVVPEWIPAASLVLLAGREGLGKSTMAAALCAQITTGRLDGGEWSGTPRNVVYLHSEDSRAHTVAPRLIAAGADMKRVLFLDVVTELTTEGQLILPADTAALDRLVIEHDVSAIVLDAATSSMSSELSGKDDRQVRQFLEPLAQLAARRDCVVLGLCHFGKRDGADTGKLILGSIAWSQVARSVLSVAKDDDTGTLLVTNTKANLATRTRTMEATIDSAVVTTDDGDAEVGVWRWIGETTRDARDLLAGSDEPATEDRNAAEAWLEDYLTEHGQTPAKAVKGDARKEGFSERTLKRAASKLGVVYESSGFPRTSHWSLPQSGHGPHSEDTDQVMHGPTGPTGPTGDDQRKRGGPTDGPTGAHPQSGQSGHTHVHGPTDGLTVTATADNADGEQGSAAVRTPGRKVGQWLGSGEPVATVTPLTIARNTERQHTPRARRRTRGGVPTDRDAG